MNDKLAHEGTTMRITMEKICKDGEKTFTLSLKICRCIKGWGMAEERLPPFPPSFFPDELWIFHLKTT
jgi:hypothetical protein